MKQLYIYTDGNQPNPSDLLRQATASLNPVELRLDRDLRKHSTHHPGVEAVIELSDGSIIEIQDPNAVVTAFNSAPDPVPPPPPPPPPSPVLPLPEDVRARTIAKKGEGNLSQQDRDALLIYLATKVAGS